jgi:GGDEF domain-containing protein
VYGFVAGDNVLRFCAMLIGEVVDEMGTSSDFIGHAGGDNFIIITTENAAPSIKQRLKERFAEEVQTHYNFHRSSTRIYDGSGKQRAGESSFYDACCRDCCAFRIWLC